MITEENISYTADEIKAMVKTIEELRKKYNGALERAKDMFTYKEVCQEDMEYLFPELKEKESEDDAIKEGLIEYFRSQEKLYDKLIGSITIKEVLTWIKKQGEKDPCIGCTNDKGCVICENGNLKEIKIESKFKVGYWVVSNNTGDVWQIGARYTKEGQHLYLSNVNNVIMSITLDELNNDYHLWTINDAKDGDVISYDDGWTCIFKNIHGIWYSSYCFITADGEFHTGYEQHAVDTKLNGSANPATKEQCDLLFQKMKEAGYVWDIEKKELRKMKAVNEDEMIKGEISFTSKEANEKYITWLEKQSEQKSNSCSRTSAIEAIKENVGNNNKVELKFHPGDWVILNGIVAKILDNFKNGFVGLDIDGKDFFCNYGHIDSMRLWTIADAKDGDILVNSKGQPFIFSGKYDDRNSSNPIAYCGVNCQNKFKISNGTHWTNKNEVAPATKEQRELLFAKMRDSGYEWDAEKKEVKKMEVASKESEEKQMIERLKSCVYAADLTIDGRNELIAWLEKQSKKKSTDEVLKIRQELYQSGYNDGYKHGKEDTILSLGKDSIEALEHFVRGIGESGYASPYDNRTKLVYTLLERLKQIVK